MVFLSDYDTGKNEEIAEVDDIVISEGAKQLCESEISVDLSRRQLRVFPIQAFPYSRNVQFLYIQDNLLEELPGAFFLAFPLLRRLDLRDNKIRVLPESIGQHQCLEVLLMQNNQLIILPPQLALVKSLRGLQLSGNPLEWPPKDVISKGTDAILSFLRQAQNVDGKEESVPINLQNRTNKQTNKYKRMGVYIRPDVFRDVLQRGDTRNHNEHITNQDKDFLSIVGFHQKPLPRQVNEKKQFKQTHASNFEPCSQFQVGKKTKQEVHQGGKQSRNLMMRNLKSPENALVVFRGQPFPLGYRKRRVSSAEPKICKALINEMWTTQLKRILQEQNRILQAVKDKEALRKWRQEAKELQSSNLFPDWPGINPPFEYEKDYLSLMSRHDLLQSQNKSLEKRGHSKPSKFCVKAPSVDEKVLQLLRELDNLHTTNATLLNDSNLKPAARIDLLSTEMQKIRGIQKSLQALRISV